MIYTYTIQTQYIPRFALTCTTLVISLFNFVFQIKSLDWGVPKILSFPQHTSSGTLPSGYYFARWNQAACYLWLHYGIPCMA
jgi:hypothetical protein